VISEHPANDLVYDPGVKRGKKTRAEARSVQTHRRAFGKIAGLRKEDLLINLGGNDVGELVVWKW
jgi:hypothetical protein